MKRFFFINFLAFWVITISSSSWPAEKKSCPDPIKAFADIDSKLLDSFDSTFFLDPEVVEKTDSRTLAKMIINRLHNVCDNLRDPKKIKKPEGSSEIVMLVPDRYLESIMQNGFKNQHQTSVTGGSNAKANRLYSEDGHVLLAIPYTNSSRELLPKYALQVFKGTKMGEFGLPTNYGNILFRFKPDVNDRATWYEDDSLGIGVPLRTNKLRPAKGTQCLGYCEAQIWGELDVSDVKSITIPKGSEVTDEMKSMGVPIYEYEMCNDFDFDGKKNSCDKKNKNKTSISKFTYESPKPIYTPPSNYVRPKVQPRDLNDIQSAFDAEKNPIAKTLLNSKRLQMSSTEDLIKEFQSSKPSEPPARSGFWQMDDHLATDRTRVLAELTGRPKTSELNRVLVEAFNNAANPSEKAIALSGLSKLDPSELKPILIESMKAPGLLSRIAISLALQMRSDPDLRDALKSGLGSEMLSHVERNELCSYEPHD